MTTTESIDTYTRPEEGAAAPSSNGVVDKAALLASSGFAVTDVALPSGRGVMKVRPLTRSEGLEAYGRQMGAAEMEQYVLAKACVEPKFTPGEIAQWQDVSAAGADIMELVQVVLHISGMDIAAGKDAYKRFRGTT